MWRCDSLPWLRPALTAAGLLLATAAHAAHPLQSEDTGTQGEGNLEFENGLSSARLGTARAFSYQPQLSWGLSPSVDLIAQPSWLKQRDGDATARGWGDTNLDAKWRFFGNAPLSLAVRAGLTLATSSQGLGNPHGKVAAHGVLVLTYDAAPFTWHANLGLSQNPNDRGERRQIGRASAALMWAANESLTLTIDGGAEADPDRSKRRWPSSLLAGAIYTLRPGLDVDAGYLAGLQSDPRRRELLLGITFRFSP